MHHHGSLPSGRGARVDADGGHRAVARPGVVAQEDRRALGVPREGGEAHLGREGGEGGREGGEAHRRWPHGGVYERNGVYPSRCSPHGSGPPCQS